jgi:uncharacterized repeat protein (TIGR03803 family)
MKPKLSLFSFRQCLVTTVLGLLVVESASAAATYKVLHSFDGTDGSSLWRGVVLDGQGDVFGTAVGGGGSGCYGYGCGTVFELSRKTGKWRFAVVQDFGSGQNGAIPYGGLVLDASGNLYGTTTMGGADNSGTAFELSPDADGWSLTTLYAFCSEPGCRDVGTMAALAWGKEGELYGTSQGGGTDGGEVFELAPGPGDWSYTLIHTFQPSYYNQPAPGGTNPYAALIVDSAGNLYGTTANGGALCNGWSCGVVYELKPLPGGGWKEVVLHRFHLNGTDGHTPGWGALYMDGTGRLYGTTQGGGCCGGVVYKLTLQPDGHWKEKILYQFKGGAKGYLPNAGVVMDEAGILYGITDAGGYGDCGVIYKLAPQPAGKWAYTVLHTFGHGDDGCMPEGNLAIDQNGNLYGGTVLGGAYGAGVVFRLRP